MAFSQCAAMSGCKEKALIVSRFTSPEVTRGAHQLEAKTRAPLTEALLRPEQWRMREPSKDDLDRRRAALEARLKELRPSEPTSSSQAQNGATGKAFGQAIRISTELVAGLAVGAALGYGADRLLGTSPWGFILLFLLGFAASVVNAIRAAGLGKPQPRREN
jgi:ATP synthase protein I